MKKVKEMTIYCKGCGRKIGTDDGKSTINRIMQCRKCGKYFRYEPDGKTTTEVKQPPRKSAGGMRFY